MNPRTAARVAVPACLLSMALGVFGFVFGVLNGYAMLEAAREVAPGAILAVSFSMVGALIASRRPESPIGWIFCLIGLSQGLVTFAYEYATFALITRPGALWGGPMMAWLGTWAWMPGLGLLLTFLLLLFPNGRLPAPRWRVVAWLSAMDMALILPFAIAAWPFRGPALLSATDVSPPGGWLEIIDGVFFPLLLVCGFASVLALIVRFRRSQGIERQQLKWFTYAAAISFAAVLISEVPEKTTVFGTLLLLPAVPSLPVATGIAILRYRLFDIDILINRTLVYGALTAALTLVYFSSVVLLEELFRAITGQGQNQLVTVISTLAIAALFSPFRRGVQSLIDRRFYRRKYDAARTLAAFSATVRDEVELKQLSERLLKVVQESMQPAHASLWLKESNARTPGRRDMD